MESDSGEERIAERNAERSVDAAAEAIRRLIAAHGRAVIVIDGSLSDDFFAAFAARRGIDWTQVIVFLAGEYLGAGAEAEESLRRRVTDNLLRRVPIVEFHAPRGEAANPAAVVANYAAQLVSLPPELAILGSFAARLPQGEDPATVAVVEAGRRRAISVTAARLRRVRMVFRFDEAGL